MNFFITGGTGFLGSHIANTLLERGDHVTVFDNKKHMSETQYNNCEFIKGDILDSVGLLDAVRESNPDVIIHLAAVVSGFENPNLNARVNLEGTINILETMRLLGITRGFNVSSEEVYGSFGSTVIKEDHPQNPVSPYGITKMAAERYSEFYHRAHSIGLISVRTSWVYGAGYPRNRPDLDIIHNAIKEGKESCFNGGESQLLDLTYIDDFTRGLIQLIDSQNLEHIAYHISGGIPITFIKLVEVLKELLPELKVKIGPGLLEYSYGGIPMPQKGALDISRAQNEIGYFPTISLEEGMRRYIEYVKSY